MPLCFRGWAVRPWRDYACGATVRSVGMGGRYRDDATLLDARVPLARMVTRSQLEAVAPDGSEQMSSQQGCQARPIAECSPPLE